MAPETQEQTADAKALAKTGEWEWETSRGVVKLSVETVRRYFCEKATDQEVMHFMAVAKYHRLNPWLREVYLIKYDQTKAAQIVIGRDTHARRAEEHPQYIGDEGGIIVRREDGTIEEREGEFWLEPEQLVGGWAKVYRKDREKPIVHRVRLKDWNKGQSYWNSAPAHMIAKVARAQARHEAFPTEFCGLVSEDEAQAGGADNRDIIDIPMPKSNAETAAEKTVPVAEPGSVTEAEKEHAAGMGQGDGKDEADLAAEARAREQAEAAQAPEPPPTTGQNGNGGVKVDRGAVQTRILRMAKANGETVLATLEKVAGRKISGLAALSDAEVAAVAKKVGV